MKKNFLPIFSLWRKYKILLHLDLKVILVLLFAVNLSVAGFGEGKSNPIDNPQQTTVRGTVTDNTTGEPLPGVNVIVKGTTIGAITNSDGKYTLDIPGPSVTLQFSFIGYVTQDVTMSGQATVNLAMTSDVEQLSEVVVVGYGTQRKKDLTGSVSTVSAAKLLDKPALNISEALQGKVAGLKIVQVNPAVGEPAMMRVRGTNSINSANQPLVVVDGIIGMYNVITQLNPNIIQSVDVLKDASATAIYGARGANGVILITTKRGISGKPTVEYSGYATVGTTQRRWYALDADETLYIYEQGWAVQDKYTSSPNHAKDYRGPTATGLSYSEMGMLFKKVNQGDYLMDLKGKDGNYYAPRFNTNWWNEAFRDPAFSHNHQLNIRGGSETAKFGLFLGATDEQGVLKKTDYSRISAKFTADLNVFKWLDLTSSINYSKVKRELNNMCCYLRTVVEVYAFLPPGKYPNDVDTYGKYAGLYGNNIDFPLSDAWNNPLHVQAETQNTVNMDQLTGDVGLTFKLTKDLSFKSNFAIDTYTSKNNVYNARSLGRSDIGSASINTIFYRYWQNENYFNYTKLIGNHNITGLLGASWNSTYQENFNGSNSYFFDDFYKWHNIGVGTAPRPSPSSSDSKFNLNSYYARGTYSYADKYLLTVTGRYDGSSKFGVNSKYGFFPSGSIAWRVSQEEFMKNITSISNLKLRASLGQTGNQEIGSYVTQTFIGSTNVAFGGAQVKGLYPSSVGNPDLAWETTTQFDVGIDVGILKNRISMAIDYYAKNTTDMLLSVPLPTSTTVGSVRKNYGSIENKGVEILLNTHNIKTKDFNWYTDITWSTNKNKITKLGPTGADIFTTSFQGFYNGVYRVGEPVASFYGLHRIGVFGTRDAVEAARYGLLPGDIKYADLNNDGKITFDDKDCRIIGNSFPDWELDFSNTVTYKNFDFGIEFRAVIGLTKQDWTTLFEDIPNYGGGKNVLLDAWTPYHQNTNVPEDRVLSAGAYVLELGDDNWLQDASFVRGEGMTLGYTFPQSIVSKLKISSLRAYVNAKNFSLYAPNLEALEPEGGYHWGLDPITPGIDFYGMPIPTTFSFGVNVVF